MIWKGEQNRTRLLPPLERFGAVRVTLGSPWKKTALELKDIILV
jgi:hypothetical protein